MTGWGLWGIGLQAGVCVLALVFVCWVFARILLEQDARPWLGFLLVGACEPILALVALWLTVRIDAIQQTVQQCHVICGLSTAPYLLGVGVAGIAALTFASTGCATGFQIARRRGARGWAALLLLDLLIPPLVVAGIVTGYVPLVDSEQAWALVLVAQALVVLVFGVWLWARARRKPMEQPPTTLEEALPASTDGTQHE
jgi:hypothetical protein